MDENLLYSKTPHTESMESVLLKFKFIIGFRN